MKRFYLDHAATTPLDDRVFDAMVPFMKEFYGNPSSIHSHGIEVKKAINLVRADVAFRFGVSFKDVIFTSGGTEATNLAIMGLAASYPEKKEIVTSVIEHHATIHTLDQLEKRGYIIHRIPVDQEGFLNIKELEKKINEKTLLLTLIWANNEVGTIQDIIKIGQLCKKYNIFVHVDAVQMVAHQKINVKDLPVDLLTCSAHKFYGPKGIGALIKKSDVRLDPIVYGGKQEFGYRSGTENVYGIIGFGKALELIQENTMNENNRLSEQTKTFYRLLIEECPEIILNGPKDFTKRIPGLLSLSFPGVDSQEYQYTLDQKGVSVSTGSACLSNEILESHVLKAIHILKDYGTIRISLGRDHSMEDLKTIRKLLIETYHELKN